MKWGYCNPKFEYEEIFDDTSWPWAGHKYFAYDLLMNMKPKRVVELGTHKGTSFFSLCQAVKDGDLDTELYAVDTWQGDEHAGFYNDEIYNEVKDVIGKYYDSINVRLIRKTFDEALFEFENESIDILHIDGLHTYEAVRHDFETWFPKLKKDGIILFHDIVVKRDDFGVFKFWKELKDNFQTMEFHHSYGLGVLFTSTENRMIKLKNDLELYYSYLLEDIENKKIGELQKNLIVKNQEIDIKKNENQELRKEIEEKSRAIKEKNKEILLLKSSKFWKLRNFYIYFKNGIIFLILSPHKFINKYLNLGNENNVSYLLNNVHPLKKKIDLKKTGKVDIIIPVYNGFEFLDKLFDSIFKNTLGKYRLIIVNDCSPDIRVKDFLDNVLVKNREKDIVFIENNKNLGFADSVNTAFEKFVKRNFIILNTDVELPYGWNIRLMKPIFLNNKIASTTPFTNSGAQCSFPIFFQNNEIIKGNDVNQIDSLFQRIRTKNNYIDIITGVGFCMGINKKVVDQIGFFDTKSFGRGYGEESDWCARASKSGYKNVVVPNLFVYHKHGGSFDKEEKINLSRRNLEVFFKKHPDFKNRIINFTSKDPLGCIRNAVISMLAMESTKFIDLYYGIKEIDLSKNSNISIFTKDNDKILYFRYESSTASYSYGKINDLISVFIYFKKKVNFIDKYKLLSKSEINNIKKGGFSYE